MKNNIIIVVLLSIFILSSFMLGCETSPTDTFIFPSTFGSWDALADVPEAVNAGGSLIWAGGNYLYAFIGGITESFYRYDISQNSWEALASTPLSVDDGGCLVYVNGYIYAQRGGNTLDFWKYDISANAWETMPVDFLADTYKGTLGVVNGEIYVMAENTPTFYKYNFDANDFVTLAAAPYNPYHGCSIAWNGGDTVYMRNGNGNVYFWKYSISGDSHTDLANYEDVVRRTGNALVYPTGNNIYSLRGNGTVIFEAYNISTNSWEARADAPGGIRDGGSLAWAGGGYLYAMRGDGTTDFWRFIP